MIRCLGMVIGFLLGQIGYAEAAPDPKAHPRPEAATPAATTATAPTTAPTPGSQPTDADNPTRDLSLLRDPFKMPAIAQKAGEPKTELERFSAHQYKLLGVMTGPKETRAMIVDPNGNTHFIKKNDKIGTRNGKVNRITAKTVTVYERVVNVLGKEENVVTEITMNSGAEESPPSESGDKKASLEEKLRGTSPGSAEYNKLMEEYGKLNGT